MVVLRILSLLLALGLSAPAFAAITDSDGNIVEAYESPGVQGANNFTDYTEFQCARDGTGNPLTDFGCVTNDGTLCSAVTGAICDTQRVPEGRCAAGNSGTCIFPKGAGHCVADAGTTYDDTLVGCLPDNTANHGATTGTFASTVCSAGNNSLCDMSTNDPACACQGTDTTISTWEGSICGSDSQARCSDGDPLRDVGSFAGALCTSIDTSIGGNNATGGRCGDQNRFPGLPSSPPYGVENVPKLGTPQRRPGTSLSAPTTVIRDVKVTAHWVFEPYEDPNNPFFDFHIRKIKMLGNTYYQDAGWGSAQANAANLDNTIITHLCDPPQPWQSNLPLTGHCVTNTGTECQQDTDCPGADTCEPSSKVYCWEAARDVDGLIFTRDISDSEIADANATGICPPDCRLDNNFNVFQLKAIIDAGDPSLGKDPRAGVQLALDNGVGPRMGKGDMVFVFPLTSMTWLDPDNRCYMGGDPDVVDALCTAGTCGSTSVSCTGGGAGSCPRNIGRCDNGDEPCDPTDAGACGGTEDCLVCGGTYDDSFGAYVDGYSDPVNGTPDGTPPGYYNPTGKLPLHTAGDTSLTRVGPTNDQNTDVRVPIYAIFTTGKSGAEFRDNTCDPANRDHCALGEVTSGGADGIGTGGSFTTAETPAYDPEGGPFTATSTWGQDNPGVETSGDFTFLRVFDRNAGPDGVHGCLGDNFPGGLNVACDLQLGQAGVDGSTGSDDEALVGDFSLAQDGSDITVAAFARFKMVDPTRDTPIFNVIAAIALKDESIVFPKNLDFINKTNSTWCPIDNEGEDGNCDRSAEVFCSEHGGDTNDNQICDDLEAAPCAGFGGDTDADTVCDDNDNCPFFANVGQGDANTDGIGDACTCGDTNGDGIISVLDIQGNQNATLGLTSPDTAIWDTNNDQVISVLDIQNDQNRTLGLNSQCNLTCTRQPSPVPSGIPACP